MRKLVFVCLLAGPALGQDLTMPVMNGRLIVRDPKFITVEETAGVTLYLSWLSFQLTNDTEHNWDRLVFTFKINGQCNGAPARWEIQREKTVTTRDTIVVKDFLQNFAGQVRGCHAERYEVSLVAAENSKWKVDGLTGKATDLEAERLAKERRERALRIAEEAREAAERARVRQLCSSVYRATSEKKVSDLTVREEQQVRACQAVGMYPPK